MSRPIDQHLTDEEFINYVLGDLSPDAEPDIDAHLERCPECTLSLNEYFEAEESFPAEEFEAHREEFTAMLRERIGMAARVQVPFGIAALRAVVALMPEFRPWAALVLDGAATSTAVVKASEDGRYSCSIEEDDERNVHVCVTALDPELENCAVTATAGTWSETKRMAEDYGVVQAEFTVSLGDRADRMAPMDELRLDFHVAGPREK